MTRSTIARRSLLAAGGAAFAAAAAGCGGSGTGNTSSEGTKNEIGDDPEKVEGSISYGFWDVNQQEMLEEMIKAFNEQYPNVKVSLQMTPGRNTSGSCARKFRRRPFPMCSG